VQSYSDYQSAVAQIQDLIFKTSDKVQPELLATTAIAPSLPSAVQIVGLVHALDAIAHGDSQDQALQSLDDQSVTSRQAVASQYASAGVAEGAEPSDDQRRQARESLKGLHVHWLAHPFRTSDPFTPRDRRSTPNLP
jgi:hypothetical protein